MGKPKLTGWFPRHVKPVRSGVYEVRRGGSFGLQGYAFFNAEDAEWGWLNSSPQKANADRNPLGAAQNKECRGRTHKPRGVQ